MSEPTPHPTVRHVARITLQLKTPLHLGSGRPGAFSDADLVYDANGLPAIPGSSLAGVLRSLYEKQSSEEEAAAVFGYQKGDKEAQGSRLSVSWACLHDSADQPVEGLIDPQAEKQDALLALARQPGLRDHVRITHHGVADAEGHGKFDEVALHIGHRFTFEMELRGPASDREADAARLRALADLLQTPAFRLGGKTRRGFGAVEIKRIHLGSFDLADENERRLYLQHPVSLAAKSPVLREVPVSTVRGPAAFATLRLRARGFWMFGGGSDTDIAGDAPHWAPADMAPVRDTVVTWKDQHATLHEHCLILPGSSIKGALAHRTAFHYNRLTGRFIDAEALDAAANDALENLKRQMHAFANANAAVEALFGSVKAKDGGAKDDEGQRGHVLIDDAFLPAETPTRRVPHVSIDRFTGGALDGALFDERPVVGGELTLHVHLDCPPEDLPEEALEALRLALADLAEGRLALGAGAGRGNGFFGGTAEFFVPQPERASA